MSAGSVSNVNIGTSMRPENVQAGAKAISNAVKAMADGSVADLDRMSKKIAEVIARLDSWDRQKLGSIAKSVSQGRATEGSLERHIDTLGQFAGKYGLRRDSGAEQLFRDFQQQASMLRMPFRSTDSGYGSTLYNPYAGMNTGSIAGDMNVHNLQERLRGVESGYRGGAKPTGNMLSEVNQLADGFRRASTSAHQYWEELGRIENLTQAIRLGIPPEAVPGTGPRRGPASMGKGLPIIGGHGDFYAGTTGAWMQNYLAERSNRQRTFEDEASHSRWLGNQGMIGPDRQEWEEYRRRKLVRRQNRWDENAEHERWLGNQGFIGPTAPAPPRRLGPMGMSSLGVMSSDDWYSGIDQFRQGQRDWDSDAAHRRWLGSQGMIGPNRPVRRGPMGMTQLDVLDGNSDEFYYSGIGPHRPDRVTMQAQRAAREAEDTIMRRRLDRMVNDSNATGMGLRSDGRAMMADMDLRDIWSDEKGLKKRRDLLRGRMDSEEDIGVRTQLNATDQMIVNRLAVAQTSPGSFRSGRGSRNRMMSSISNNIGYGIEDFLISSQFGGLPMAVRSVANNITPIVANLSGAGMISAGLSLPLMAGTALAATGIAMYAQRSQQQSAERMERIQVKSESALAFRGMDRNLSRGTAMGRRQGFQALDELRMSRAGLMDEGMEALSMSDAQRAEKMPGKFGMFMHEATGGLYDVITPLRETATEEFAFRRRAREIDFSRKEEARIQTMLGADERRTSYMRRVGNRPTFLGRNATFDEQFAANERSFEIERRGILAGFGPQGESTIADGQLTSAGRGLLRDWKIRRDDSRSGLALNARDGGLSLMEDLRDAVDMTPSYVKSSRRTMEQIMGNSELSLGDKLSAMTNLDKILTKDQARERSDSPPQALGDMSSVEMSALVQKMMSPASGSPDATKLGEEIRDTLKEINRKLGKPV